MLDLIVREPQLLCSISYLFVEYHGLSDGRAFAHAKPSSSTLLPHPLSHASAFCSAEGLIHYGLKKDMYDVLNQRIHRLMQQPSCKLKLYWRSRLKACGDVMRSLWTSTAQATDTPTGHPG